MLHGSFKFGGKYHTTSKLGRESTERQTSAGDVVFSTSENFSKKLLAGQQLNAGHISRPGSAKASGI